MAKNKEETEIKTDGWKDTFSDLMNLLLCFFILLYSMSSIDEAKYAELVASLSNSVSIFSGGEKAIGQGQLISSGATQLNNLDEYYSDMGKQAQEKKKRMDELYGDVVGQTEKKQLDDDLDVTIDDGYNYVMLSLNGSVLFESGSAEIQKDAKKILNRIGDVLKMYPKNTIKIEGHTDNVPIHNANYSSNLWLSTARATKVLEYFQKRGLNPNNLEASGWGDVHPIASNKTKTGRSKNRRVEIKIYGMSEN